MNKLAEIIKKLIGKIVSGEKITDEEKLEMEKALESEKENKKTDPPKEEPQLPAKSIEEFQAVITAQNEKIEKLMSALSEEQKQREQNRLALENEAKTKRAAEIKAIIEKAVKSTYLAPADETGKASWQNLLETNFDNASKLLQSHIEAAEKKAKPPEGGKTDNHKSTESFTKLGSNLLPGLKEYINN